MGIAYWNGSAFVDVEPSLANASNVPTAAWIWNGSAYVQVWSAVELLSFSDDFNRSDQYLDVSPNWDQYSTGSLTYRSYISSNVLTVFHNTTDSTTPSWGKWTTPTNTDDQYVEATVTGTVNTTHNAWLILGGNGSLGVWIAVQIGGNASGIYSTNNGGGTITQRASATNATSSGQVWRMERVDDVYTAFRDGAQIAQFDNSGGAVSGTGRYVGLGTTRRRTFFANSQSIPLDNWSAGDLAA